MVLAIDPGNIQSAWVIIGDNYKPIAHEITENNELTLLFRTGQMYRTSDVAIEMIASYGMAVGATVFDTCVWIGRFHEMLESHGRKVGYVYRKDVKMNLCGSTRAKDSNIRQALIDRFGVVGTKAKPGFFYGFKKDIWAAYAVGVSYLDSNPKLAT